MQTQDEHGQWWLNVSYRPPGELTSHLHTFPADQVRPDTIDRSRGRQ